MLLVLSVWADLAGASPIAARVEGEEIPTAAVDAMSIGEVRRIRSRLAETAQRAMQNLIDERLGIGSMPQAELSRERSGIYRAQDVKLMLPTSDALETALPPDQVVARMGDDVIRAAALEQAAAVRLYRLRGELYLQRRRDLDALIERRLLQLEARSRGVPLDELEKSFSQVAPVSDAEVEAFVSRERAAGRVIENPQRVRPYLEFQKRYLRRANVLQARRARTQIRIDLRPPARPRLEVDARGGVPLGSPDGPVLLVYTNYRCELCRATHLELDRLLATSRPPRIVLRDFVRDAAAMQAAALIRCAARTSRAAAVRGFLLRSDPPRSSEESFGAEQLLTAARIAGMTPSALRACMDSPEVRARIEQDTLTVQRLGFDDPPAFIAAGVPLSGMQTAERLSEALSGRSDAELSAD